MNEQKDEQKNKDADKVDRADRADKKMAHESERHQDPKLAEQGIYQPFDKISNQPDPVEESEELAEHRKNLAYIRPVPSESAGAASQAK